jgi:exonuclease III
MTSFKNLALGNWNVRGLNDDNKCELVRDSLSSNAFDVIFLQETKLQAISTFKKNSFLPTRHDCFEHVEALGTAGGILTSWNSRDFKCCYAVTNNRSLTVHLHSEISDFHFWATNVYGPTVDSERDDFFEEIRQIVPLIDGPWIVTGDFNTVRSGEDRSSGRAPLSETRRFNDAVRDLLLQELPLLDRDFTWSNLQHPPILAEEKLSMGKENHGPLRYYSKNSKTELSLVMCKQLLAKIRYINISHLLSPVVPSFIYIPGNSLAFEVAWGN